MRPAKPRRIGFLAVGVTALLLLGMACGGGTPAPASPSPPPQPQAPAPPAPAAPALEPQAAPPRPVVPREALPAPKPAAPQAKEPKYGGIMLVGNGPDPPVWDPMLQATIFLLHPLGSVSGDGALLKGCREDIYKICPSFAEQWESNSDFTQWTFKIRDNILWHDGTRFTAEDAKFWMDLSFFGAQTGDKKRTPATYRGQLGDLKSVEVLPGQRLRVTLKRPHPVYPEFVASPDLRNVYPRHLFEPRLKAGDMRVSPLELGLVGTGPFKFVKYDKGVRIQVRKFDRYWEKDEKGRQLPFLDGIDFVIIPDIGALDAAFRTGRLDGGARGSPHSTLTRERLAGYKRDLGDKVWFAEVTWVLHGMTVNVIKPGPLQDVRVRKAIQLYMDKQEAIDSVLGGSGVPYTFVNPSSPWPDPNFRTWPGFNAATKSQDRAQAKRLMAEAGHPDGGFKLLLPVRSVWKDRFEYVHGQLKGLGIEAVPKILDGAAYEELARGLEWDLILGGGCSAATFPEICEDTNTRHSVSPSNGTKHEDAKMDEFFVRMGRARTFEERVKAYREFERYAILEQAYYFPLFGTIAKVPYRSYVKGLPVPAENLRANTDFATVWLDK